MTPARGILALAALLAISATIATAHPLAPALLEIRAASDGTSDVRLRTSAATAELGARLPERCATIEAPPPALAGGAIERTSRVACELRPGDAVALDGLAEAGTDAVLRLVDRGGAVTQALLTAREPRFEIDAPRGSLAIAWDYLALGVEHLATGFDHLLFVAGLFLLVADRRALVWTLTAFTLGHSVTLAAAVLGFVHVPAALVEVGIAVSLLVLAAEIGEPARPRAAFARRPFTMAAGFGLLHGLGFAGALAETGLPSGEIPLALLSFNAGIEIGQLAAAGGLTALAAIGARTGITVPRVAAAYGIGGLAGYWFFARSSVFFG